MKLIILECTEEELKAKKGILDSIRTIFRTFNTLRNFVRKPAKFCPETCEILSETCEILSETCEILSGGIYEKAHKQGI